MDLYDYLKVQVGKNIFFNGMGKLALASLVFYSGSLFNADFNRGKYSTAGVNIVSKEVGNKDFGNEEMEFLEVNEKRLYVPCTDGDGKIRSIFRIDKIVIDLDKERRYYEGMSYKLKEEGQIRVDTRSLDSMMR